MGAAGDGGVAAVRASQHLPDVDFAAFARGLGLGGLRVDTPDRVGAAWEEALSADRPYVLDFVTDPNVPPIPPHARWEEISNTAKAVLSGDPEAKNLVKQGLKTKAQDFLPGGKQ